MFENLVSILPFSPGAAHQLGFYARRMKEESAIRRMGLLFIVLAFMIQFFAFVSPPQPTVADSVNDLINNGFTKPAQAETACQNNSNNYGNIMANYGIACTDIVHGTTMDIKSTDFGNTLYSMGWKSEGVVNQTTHKQTNETKVNLVGTSRTPYWRLLSNWDSGAYSTYQVIKVTASKTGHVFYIMYRCGNLVTTDIHTEIPPCPYNGAVLTGTPQCYNPCPYNTSIPIGTAACHPKPCPLNGSIYITDARCTACPYDSTIIKSDSKCVQCPNPHFPTVTASNPTCLKVCPYNNAYNVGDANCKPCTASSNSGDSLACVVESKSANDTTAGWTTTTNAPQDAQANDTIVYTLKANNAGKATIVQFVMEENISDVLDYADVVSLDGGTLNPVTGEIVWPAVDIKPAQTESHTVTVKVKAVIPDTPASVSDPGHYDSIMTNTYGNTVNIPVPQNVIKTAAVITTTTLINTGPGTSMFIGGGIVILAAYFYSRSRLLAKESKLVLQETSGGF